MHTSWTTIRTFAVVLLSSGAIYAQEPGRSTNFVTVNGCVERADQVANTSPPSQTVDADSRQFVLLPAVPPTDRAGRQAPAPGASAAATRGPLYRLDAEVATITPHVGHEVEIKGIVTAASAPAPAADTATNENVARLKVEAIRTLAQTCAR